MKKVLFGIVCLLVLSLSVYAQPGQGGNRQRLSPEESAKQETQTLKTELKLKDNQVAPVEAANLVYFKELAKLRENAGGDFSSMRESMQKLENQRIASFEKVLTKEQLDAYKKYSEERRQRGPGQRGQGQGGQGGGRRN